MGFFAFFGSLMIGGAIAVLFERLRITHNGLVPSIIIALGAVVVLFMLRALFHLSFGSPGVDAIIGSAAALVLIPADSARRRRGRNRRR
ncbi:hypothetical protein [Nioella nitratireducens]|uniref:hypothetical protein n=1 Tax=Nioella nitratireducens TaxID=1287720 RepID=UPI0008FD47F0|nr:hypothetical protein [Nioella nitratireducens]